MAPSQYDVFLTEATINDHTDSTLGRDCLYGLYTSWCLLHHLEPGTEVTFWAAMKKKHIHPGHNGLRMKGPAAADYILASYPGLV
ncbi:hypothetical protein [[Micrococcus luteus] ATCC 49442]|uniref:hypothetical protein n=1 Tax=[Micrococcus luteus] ATCC 49442 TaxID=2698727 RepID=UPI0013DAF3B9|nr:hypothetical protein [[Micrococcus luteus] ATCC 49442]